jgi:hypothetical protein
LAHATLLSFASPKESKQRKGDFGQSLRGAEAARALLGEQLLAQNLLAELRSVPALIFVRSVL